MPISLLAYIIETIAVSIGEEVDTIEDVYEPYLIQIGFISRTPRGRLVMPPAYAHLGYPYLGLIYLINRGYKSEKNFYSCTNVQ